MKNYDDLQRFKEKTQINHVEFKDLSQQTRGTGLSDWPLIRQLMQTRSDGPLDNAPSLRINAPEAINPDHFRRPEIESSLSSATVATAAMRPAPEETTSSAPFPDRPAASLLNEVATSLHAPEKGPATALGRALLNSVAAALPARAAPVAQEPVIAAQALPENAPAQPALASTFSAAPPAAPARRFGQLFGTSKTMQTDPLSKQTPLQPLLEKIASCR